MATRMKPQAGTAEAGQGKPTPAPQSAASDAIQTVKHRARRKNIPPAGLNGQGRVEEAPRVRHHFNPHLSPLLRLADDPAAADRLPALLQTARERALSDDEAQLLAAALRRHEPWLEWSGKRERPWFEVEPIALHIHERVSTQAMLRVLAREDVNRDLFADPQQSYAEAVQFYRHDVDWSNRMILGDSLGVMASLARREDLAGKVQMIYLDPPYGISFKSNFQPQLGQRDVKDKVQDLTREPEMVKAYRDTWELGLHSYLTYLRDRLLVARELLTPSGSVFVQISDENVHHVRELMDDVFGAGNHCGIVNFAKTSGATSTLLATVSDYLLWYARDVNHVKYRQLYGARPAIESPSERYVCVETPGGAIIDLSVAQKTGEVPLPEGRVLRLRPTDSPGATDDSKNAVFVDGQPLYPPTGRHWSVTATGTQRAVERGRTFLVGKTLRWKAYHDEFPFRPLNNSWTDVSVSGFNEAKLYVVQTLREVIQRCALMTTDPGDLLLDPTCGSGTTAHVAEQWGRRWITVNTSRVPLALARQRLLTATFPYYELQDSARGPAAGFTYTRRQNKKGEEVGGIVPHVTLKSIANDEPPAEEVLVDRPEVDSKITRVTGPFVVEATIPTPVDIDGDGTEDSGVPDDGSYVDRMLEALRRNPSLSLPGNRKIELKEVRPPGQSLMLSGEAGIEPDSAPAAIVFGPENGAVSEKLVYEAAREAHMKHFDHLLVIGFAIEPNARALVEKVEQQIGIPATYVQATPDLVMGDLLKTMRSSQLFSVSGLPDIAIRKVEPEEKGGPQRYEVELLGLDTFDPTTFEAEHRDGADVPAWLLDTAWNGLSFHVSQAFFPRTGAWDNLRKALKGELEDTVWDHLAGTTSAPFTAADVREIAVKVIDDRGNELVVVRSLDEAT